LFIEKNYLLLQPKKNHFMKPFLRALFLLRPLQGNLGYKQLIVNVLIMFCVIFFCIFALCFTKKNIQMGFYGGRVKNYNSKLR